MKALKIASILWIAGGLYAENSRGGYYCVNSDHDTEVPVNGKCPEGYEAVARKYTVYAMAQDEKLADKSRADCAGKQPNEICGARSLLPGGRIMGRCENTTNGFRCRQPQ